MDNFQFRIGLWAAAALIIIAVAFIGGCAARPLPAPETPRQSLAYTEASYTAVVDTLSSLRTQGALTPGQITQADVAIVRGDTVLSGAHAALKAGDTATLQGRLAAVNGLLVELRTLLKENAAHE